MSYSEWERGESLLEGRASYLLAKARGAPEHLALYRGKWAKVDWLRRWTGWSRKAKECRVTYCDIDTALLLESPHDDTRLDRAALAVAIKTLPPAQQTVLALCYGRELTLKQAAQIMGLSEGMVSKHRTAAIKALRGIMQGDER